MAPHSSTHLENPMDGGAWWATVHGVAESQTQLKRLSSSSSSSGALEVGGRQTFCITLFLFSQSLCFVHSFIRCLL